MGKNDIKIAEEAKPPKKKAAKKLPASERPKKAKPEDKEIDISLVVPIHNEMETLGEFVARTGPILTSLTQKWEIIFVNDGSSDDSFKLLEAYAGKDKRIKVISFSRNFGKEAATTAGINASTGKVVIPMDCDLQDPPELIPQMVEKWYNGAKVVVATRKSRKGDGFLKRFWAKIFYKTFRRIAKVDIPENTGDFRLMDRQVVEAIKTLPEKTRFMKGLFAWLGYNTETVFFERQERKGGKSSFGFSNSFRHALDGIFSFSTWPLKVWIYVGSVISSIAFVFGTWIMLKTLIYGADQPGYASTMVVILFLGGIQLISLGVIGGYIGRIYEETKNRPLYVVDKEIGFDKENG